jgi:hypothetical protein
METYIGIGVIAAFLGIFVVGILLGNRRRKALKELAPTMNFSFSEAFLDEDDDPLKQLSHLALFHPGRNPEAWDLMQRSDGDLSITIMENRFGSGSTGKASNTSEQTVIVFQSSALRLPDFTLRHEDLAHRFSTAVLGYKDIDFSSHPRFSKHYHLHGTDEDAIRQVFNDELLSFYEQHDDLCTDGSRDRLVLFRPRKTVAVNQFSSFLDESLEVFRLFKARSEYIHS